MSAVDVSAASIWLTNSRSASSPDNSFNSAATALASSLDRPIAIAKSSNAPAPSPTPNSANLSLTSFIASAVPLASKPICLVANANASKSLVVVLAVFANT